MSAKTKEIYEALLPAGIDEADEQRRPAAAAEAPPVRASIFCLLSV